MCERAGVAWLGQGVVVVMLAGMSEPLSVYSYVTCLQAYLKQLMAGAGGARGLGFARVGIQCLATLLPALYHFNYASDLLQVD